MSSSKPKSAGTPAWVVTFADLMTLLMCFFVLLFSMSQLDAEKYSSVAAAMSSALGGKVVVTPSGNTSLNSPASPLSLLSTPIPTIKTTNPALNKSRNSPTRAEIQNQKNYSALSKALEQEQKLGLMEIKQDEGKVIIRFQGAIAFYPGSESLAPNFVPILKNIAHALSAVPGQLIVSGHTDDRPITTQRFRSNWDLSTARAVTVVHYIINSTDIEPSRITAQGHADTHPLISNTTETGRDKNRRVEIILDSENETKTKKL